MSDETPQQTTQKNPEEKSKAEKPVVKASVGRKKKFAFTILNGRGQVHIHATYNNTIVSVTDSKGNVIAWSSAGKCGFKGAKKATPYVAGIIVKSIIDKTKQAGVREAEVFLQGVGAGRESAIRAFVANGVQILSIKDRTGVAHNGPRKPKPRRV